MMLTLAAAAAVTAMMPPARAVGTPQVLTPGTITIAPATGAALPDETGQIFTEAVRRAASTVGFTVLPGLDHGRYTARVTVSRLSRGVVASGRAASPAPLASLGGGVSLDLPAGGVRYSDLVVTTLTVVLSYRGDTRAIWSGSAVTARTADSRSGSVAVVASILADAVLSQFPGQAAAPVSVP